MPDVTGITALDVAIGLAFVYLLFSVLCSAIQEAIAGVLDLRARTLERGLKNLLEDNGGPNENGAPRAVDASLGDASADCEPLFEKLISHGLIRTQYRDAAWWNGTRDRRGPSYIPSKTFALALLDIVERLSPATVEDGSPRTLVTRIVHAPVPAGTKHALLALAKDGGDDRERLRKRVEEWFDAGMDRVSGWYKRMAQIIICVLALAVTVVFNVNSIAIADRLVRDDVVRAAVVADATKTKPPGQSLGPALKRIETTRELGLPIGFNKQDGGPLKMLKEDFLKTTGGWLITVVMLSLGAPFWFGALGRLVALRSAGVKPGTKPEPARAL